MGGRLYGSLRFWGTNFNSAANFPSQPYSETFARRLAMFGVNLDTLGGNPSARDYLTNTASREDCI